MIIGITGSTRGGKTTAGKFLQEALQATGNLFVLVNYSDPFLNLADRVGLSTEDTFKEDTQQVPRYDDESIPATIQQWVSEWFAGESSLYQASLYATIVDALEEEGLLSSYSLQCSLREFMICVGQAGRRFDTDCWVAVVQQIEQIAESQGCQGVIVTGVRKENEATACDVLVAVVGRTPVSSGHKVDEQLEGLIQASEYNILNTKGLDDLRLRCLEISADLLHQYSEV